MLTPILLIMKPVVYLVIVALAAHRWRLSVPMTWWRPVLAAVVRTAAGLLVGLPLGVLLLGVASRSLAFELGVLLPVRFALWAATAWLFYRAAPPRERMAFAVIAALLSTALEMVSTPEHSWVRSVDGIRIC